MKLLLDTHVLLWWLAADKRLSTRAQALVAAAENAVFVSAATVWEIRIKEALGKLKLGANFADALSSGGFESLPVSALHAHALRGLPMHHRDPFDRMLVVQAQLDGLTLVTHDVVMARYDVAIEVV